MRSLRLSLPLALIALAVPASALAGKSTGGAGYPGTTTSTGGGATAPSTGSLPGSTAPSGQSETPANSPATATQAPGEGNGNGGSSLPGSTAPGGEGETPAAPTTPVTNGILLASGKVRAPVNAPAAVKKAIRAANKLIGKPYVYGGGHQRWDDTGYDCSGAVSYALRGGGLLTSPLDSSLLMKWGKTGAGKWITVYANPNHTFAVIAGVRFDTGGSDARGPRWRADLRPTGAYKARHPNGL